MSDAEDEDIIIESQKFGKVKKLSLGSRSNRFGDLQRTSLKEAELESVYAICSGCSSCSATGGGECC